MFKSAVALALIGAVAAIGPTWTDVEETPVLSHTTASRLTLAFTAYFGVDRFYMGYLIVGALKALTFGGAGIWVLIDAIFITHCWLLDNWGRVLEGCECGMNNGGPVQHGRCKDAAAAEEKPAETVDDVVADDAAASF
jgi:TM2 domain-containing membrane protein YozV